jgi:hypothetical protein
MEEETRYHNDLKRRRNQVMKSRFLLLLWLTISLIGSLAAQTAMDPNEGLRIAKDSSGDGLTLFWYGRTGRTYFVQQSPDLLQWKYLPIMDSGTGAPLSYGVSTTASRGFFRLSYTDDPLAGDPDGDFDGDGMSNMDELLNAQYGYDPFDYFNGLRPTLSLLGGGGQWGQPGTVLAQPISVSVNFGALNAPVTFTISSGGALLSKDGNVPWSNHLSVRSSSGNTPSSAKAYVKLPTVGGQSNITMTAGYASLTTQLQTTATTYDATVPTPTSLQAVTLSDSEVRLSWVPADVTRATSIEISTDNGASWQLYDVAAPGASSFIINGLSFGQQVLLRVITGDERKAGVQNSSLMNTLDVLKGYAGLWGGLWEAVDEYWTATSHMVTLPSPEPLSAPSQPVSTSSMGPLIIDMFEKVFDCEYYGDEFSSWFYGYVNFFGYDLLSGDTIWHSALSIPLASSADRRNEVRSTFESTPFDDLIPYRSLARNETFSCAVHYHADFEDINGSGEFNYEDWGYAHQLHIRQDTVASPDSNAGPAIVVDTRAYLVLGEHGNGSGGPPDKLDFTGTLIFTKYSDGSSHIDTSGNMPAGTVVVDNNAHSVTLRPYSRSGNEYNTWFRLVPLELKSKTNPYGWPATNTMNLKKVDNLISVWPDQKLNLTVGIPDPDMVTNQNSSIVWTTPENTPPSPNSLEATLEWNSPGTKIVEALVFGHKLRAVVNVPDVGLVSEMQVVQMTPFWAVNAVYYSEFTDAWASNYGDPNGNAEANALKHSYWNALMASDILVGRTGALFCSTAHEFSGKATGAIAYDTCMDLHNNFEGSMVIFSTVLGTPDTDPIKTVLLSKKNSGTLWIVGSEAENLMILKSGSHRKIFQSNSN